MSFKSINHILGVEAQRWQEQPFQILQKCWHEAVGAAVAANARPVSMQRDVLWVATSSGAWAQTLTFERQRILQKLNPHLPSPLVDIRFSTAQWKQPKSDLDAVSSFPAQAVLWRFHPSRVADVSRASADVATDGKDLNAAFGNWSKVMQARSRNLPLCPQCQSPTPPGEIERWSVCAICSTKPF